MRRRWRHLHAVSWGAEPSDEQHEEPSDEQYEDEQYEEASPPAPPSCVRCGHEVLSGRAALDVPEIVSCACVCHATWRFIWSLPPAS